MNDLKGGLIYLASPYSDPDPEVECDRFEAVCAEAGRLMAAGWIVYSPIAHGHPIAARVALPRDQEFWRVHNQMILAKSAQLWVLKLDGWEESEGITAEIIYATVARLPIRYIDPGGDV